MSYNKKLFSINSRLRISNTIIKKKKNFNFIKKKTIDTEILCFEINMIKAYCTIKFIKYMKEKMTLSYILTKIVITQLLSRYCSLQPDKFDNFDKFNYTIKQTHLHVIFQRKKIFQYNWQTLIIWFWDSSLTNRKPWDCRQFI